MHQRYLAVLLVFATMLLFSAGISHADNLPENCITFEQTKFSYAPKGNNQHGIKKIWTQFTNNCGVNISEGTFFLKGETSKDSPPSNWSYDFTIGLRAAKAGETITAAGQYNASDAQLLRITIQKDQKIIGEKIFELKDFDKFRLVTQPHGKLKDKSPNLPKNLQKLK
ncbi:MAG: hypothetical protein RBT37_02345 [Dissulfurispiraceae bacterium]|jgi:hypothetical protein|nr:hypothetical protein [Dissulfurispiraceae bacterium]